MNDDATLFDIWHHPDPTFIVGHHEASIGTEIGTGSAPSVATMYVSKDLEVGIKVLCDSSIDCHGALPIYQIRDMTLQIVVHVAP